MAHSDPKKGRKPTEPRPWPLPDDREKRKAPKPGSFASIVANYVTRVRQKRQQTKKEGGS